MRARRLSKPVVVGVLVVVGGGGNTLFDDVRCSNHCSRMSLLMRSGGKRCEAMIRDDRTLAGAGGSGRKWGRKASESGPVEKRFKGTIDCGPNLHSCWHVTAWAGGLDRWTIGLSEVSGEGVQLPQLYIVCEPIDPRRNAEN